MTLILVTGATGFLGTRIARQLIAAGHRVRTASRSLRTASPAEHFVADLTRDELAPLVARCDVVIHAAGLAHQFRPSATLAAEMTAHNALATRRLAEAAAAAGVERFVLASSVSVYGQRAVGLVAETSSCRPSGDYARSKMQAEAELLEVCQRGLLRPVILRLATLYGAHDRGNVARLMWTIDRGRFVWIGDGSNRKSLLHVDDAANACVSAATCIATNGDDAVFNVAAEPVTMREIVDQLAAALGRPLPRVRLPTWPAKLALSACRVVPFASTRAVRWQMTLRKWLADDAYCGHRFAHAFGFTPQVDLAGGIMRQVAAFRTAIPGAAANRLAA